MSQNNYLILISTIKHVIIVTVLCVAVEGLRQTDEDDAVRLSLDPPDSALRFLAEDICDRENQNDFIEVSAIIGHI